MHIQVETQFQRLSPDSPDGTLFYGVHRPAISAQQFHSDHSPPPKPEQQQIHHPGHTRVASAGSSGFIDTPICTFTLPDLTIYSGKPKFLGVTHGLFHH